MEETCKFYVSPEQPECGKPFDSFVTTHITRRDQARVPLCKAHKRQYNQQMARLRAESKQTVDGA